MQLRTYPLGAQFGLLVGEEHEHVLATEEEVVNMSEKITFASDARANSTALAAAIEKALKFAEIYFDRGYNDVGEDSIEEVDLIGTGTTAALLASYVTLGQQLGELLAGNATVPADYGATLNKMRTGV